MRVKATCGVLMVCAVLGVGAAAAAEKPAKAAKPKAAAPPADENLLRLLLHTNADPDSGPPPLKVQFECEVYAGDEAVNPKYEWDFGDGSPKLRQRNPTHVYKKPGKYNATITVTDAKHRKGTDELLIEVEAPE